MPREGGLVPVRSLKNCKNIFLIDSDVLSFQENLRKHALRRRLHPGLPLYRCRVGACAYGVNTATELRAHLTIEHADQYSAKEAVEAVKRHLLIE